MALATSSRQRSRLHMCGWPWTLPWSRLRLLWMVGRQVLSMSREKWVESWRCRRHDRCRAVLRRYGEQSSPPCVARPGFGDRVPSVSRPSSVDAQLRPTLATAVHPI